MKKVWKSKNGRRTMEMTFLIEKTTLKEKLGCLATIIIVGLVWYLFLK